MGFNRNWVDLIMTCVSTVSFSVLINSEPKGPINLSRGLRQGDPLSLYMFLFCIERLICLLQQAIAENQIEGIQICRRAPRINHLLFANDCVLFCKANMQET